MECYRSSCIGRFICQIMFCQKFKYNWIICLFNSTATGTGFFHAIQRKTIFHCSFFVFFTMLFHLFYEYFNLFFFAPAHLRGILCSINHIDKHLICFLPWYFNA